MSKIDNPGMKKFADFIGFGRPLGAQEDLLFFREIQTLKICTTLSIVVGLVFIPEYYQLGLGFMSVAVTGTCLLGIFNLFLIHHTGKVKLGGHITVSGLLALLLLSNSVSGGFFDPNFSFFGTIPILAGLLLGIRALFFYSFVILIITLVFYSLPSYGIIVPNLIPQEQHGAQSLANRIGALVLFTAICFGFLLQRLRTEQALLKQKKIAEDSAATKSQFLAKMSHEIRTPLNGVLGLSEILGNTRLDETQDKYLRSIQNSGKTLQVVINDILQFSKMEADSLTLVKKEFSPAQLVEEIDEIYRLRTEKDLKFNSKVDETLPKTLIGDPVRLTQVINNLLNNAFKFTQNGFVELQVSKIKENLNSVLLEVRVVDSGIGINPNQQENLFEPFIQLNPELQIQQPGIGLGLSISKNLIELMGGTISLQSTPGQGTTFYFQVLMEKPEFKERETINKTNLNGELCVLLAEDNEVNQMVALECLSRLNAHSILAKDGAEALEQMRTKHDSIDFVLMDCEMPYINGFEATREIRRWEQEQQKTPLYICALTAQAIEEQITNIFDSGMNAYISKPFALEDIQAEIKSAQSQVKKHS